MYGLLSIFLSCANDKIAEITEVDLDCDTTTYNLDMNFIINEGCARIGCHDVAETAPGNFTTYEDMLPYLQNGTFNERAIVKMDMPPSGPLDAAIIDSLNCWISTGFAE